MTPTPLTDDELAVFERMTVVYPGAVARLSAGVPDAVARLLSEVRARRAASRCRECSCPGFVFHENREMDWCERIGCEHQIEAHRPAKGAAERDEKGAKT